MELLDKKTIRLNKNLNKLDELVIKFTGALEQLGVKYVIISGYVAILFGRNRSSEDVDVIMEKMSLEKFKKLWDLLYKSFECLNTENSREAYAEYLLNNNAIRFSAKGDFVPNMEVKFPKSELDSWSVKERVKVLLNNNPVFISPLELQISFKVFLGSEKDIEDARFLFKIFHKSLDNNLLQEFNRKLKIEAEFNKYIK